MLFYFDWPSASTLVMLPDCVVQGQCGLGTPLETLAAQRRAEWDMGAVATPSQASQSLGLRGGREGWGPEGQGGASSSHSTGWAWAQQQQQQQQQEQSAQHAHRMAPYLQPYAEHTARQAELDQMRRCPFHPTQKSSCCNKWQNIYSILDPGFFLSGRKVTLSMCWPMV